MKRKHLLLEMDKILSDYCQGCFLHKHNKKEQGRTYAHSFCITKCTVGEKIKDIGTKLSH